jgi:hypothetical protein
VRSWAPLAAAHGDLVAVEVDVLDAQGQRLVDPQTRAVEQLTQEPEGRLQLVEQGAYGGAGEHGGEVFGAAGALEAVEGGHVDLEHLAVEKDQRAKRLVLRRGRGALAYGQVVEEGRLIKLHGFPGVAWGIDLVGLSDERRRQWRGNSEAPADSGHIHFSAMICGTL